MVAKQFVIWCGNGSEILKRETAEASKRRVRVKWQEMRGKRPFLELESRARLQARSLSERKSDCEEKE